jgi:L-threonylcarbamoyladenylate synthase
MTLILKKQPHVLDSVTGGQDTVGIRIPNHPVAQQLLSAFGGGLAAPSANRFGYISPTSAEHVRQDLGNKIDMILEGGTCEVGIESTIVDLTRLATVGPVVLRPGQISVIQLAQCLGRMPGLPTSSDAAAPRVSGSLDAHYAPKTPLVLIDAAELVSLLQRLDAAGVTYALMQYSSLASEQQHAVVNEPMPNRAEAYARRLYASLRTLDTQNAALIVIERPPSGDEWQGINDRLRRAAFDSSDILKQLLKR